MAREDITERYVCMYYPYVTPKIPTRRYCLECSGYCAEDFEGSPYTDPLLGEKTEQGYQYISLSRSACLPLSAKCDKCGKGLSTYKWEERGYALWKMKCMYCNKNTLHDQFCSETSPSSFYNARCTRCGTYRILPGKEYLFR